MEKTHDHFFNAKTCDRCPNTLQCRTMSWFTEEAICMECSAKEDQIRKKLNEKFGPRTDLAYEGCGYLPDPDRETQPPAFSRRT